MQTNIPTIDIGERVAQRINERKDGSYKLHPKMKPQLRQRTMEIKCANERNWGLRENLKQHAPPTMLQRMDEGYK